ncbi:MAG: hypothetical protein N2578_09955, partial [Bdellovibrionaceae bacterium]|nr:hypothetical protein [Pseudobdellovibrionaceae bacterium]
IQYTVEYAAAREPVIAYIPPSKDKGVWDHGKKRELYLMRYMMLDPRRLRRYLAPHLCRQNPGASRVLIEYVIDPIPPIDEVILSDSEVRDMGEAYDLTRTEMECGEKPDEEVL